MAQTTSKRIRAEKKGRSAETLVSLWLRLKGYKVLSRRVRTPKGEIDIIAQKGDTICFIEVKARKSFDLAIQSVLPSQAKRITAAARYWIATQEMSEDFTYRFDIILVKPYLSIRHIISAFDESGQAT